ncbi:MAG: hypothetical protein GY732_05420, partial [Gammaproteobacteria bacterium]|nr:hypothetical protein [Gammaproteobacteria bacterium]
VSTGDINNDGYPDICVVIYNQQNKLWINDGAGNFTGNDISGDDGSSAALVMGDIDNDGDLDIYVAKGNGEQNKLWINGFPTTSPYLTANTTQAFTSTVTSFTETLAVDNAGTVAYQVSTDAGATWNYWTGAAWATTTATDGTETSTASVINTNITTLDTDGGNFTWRAYLTSDGIQKVELDQIDIAIAESIVNITANDATAAESATNTGQFTVDLGAVNNTGGDVTVSYTVTGTATGGTDYTSLSGTLVISDGSQSATIDVSGIIEDTLVEGDETVIVTLDSTSHTLFTISVSNSDTVTIQDINSPTAANNTVTTNEDTTYTFIAADFNYSDPESDPMASVKITTLETVGSLQLNGIDVTINQVITKADIDAGNLTFVPVAEETGTGYDSFGFSVNDGTDDSVSTYAMTLDVTAVNDIPVITNLGGDALAYTEGDGAQIIDQSTNAAVTDVDSSDFNTGTLTVSFTAGSDSAEDVLAINNEGTAAGQTGVSGSNVTYAGTIIGTFTGGSSGANLVITLNANAT